MNDLAAQIIKYTIYAAVATSDQTGAPWNSPVYIVYDEKLRFYWASAKDSQHSRNIRSNPRVFLTIYNSSVPWGAGEGVFIQAEATEINDPDEIAKVCDLRERRDPKANQPPENFIDEQPRRIYRANPHKIWVNQAGTLNGSFIDRRVEINLASLLKSKPFHSH